MKINKSVLATLALTTLGITSSYAQVSKPITKLPFVISKPGNYHLPKDLALTKTLPAGTDSAITVLASDVTINLNGRSISSSVDANAAIGTQQANVTGVRVQNGTIRGFETGLFLVSNAGGLLVQDLTVEGCKSGGIFLVGPGSTVRRCNARAIGGTTSGGDPAGVIVSGIATTVEDTTIIDVLGAQGSDVTTGIGSNGGTAIISRCQVVNTGTAPANSVGLRISGDGSIVTDNRIVNYDNGLSLFSAASKFRDNVFAKCATNSIGGTDIGNNK